MSESKEVAFLPTAETAMTVFTTSGAIDPYLAQIRAEIDLFIPDISTKKGRDAIASMAYKVSQSKSALEALGKAQADKAKEIPKLIDATRKHVKDTLDKWRDEVRQPLTDWENAEAERVARHKAEIDWLNSLVFCDGISADEIALKLQQAKDFDVSERLEEFESEAAKIKINAISGLESAFAIRKKFEDDQAELARLRQEAAEREQKEREERIAREAAEKAKREAEEAAESERRRLQDEADRKEREAKLAIERAQREKAEQEAAALRKEQEHAAALAKAEQDRKDAVARAEADKQAAIKAEQLRQQQEAERLRVEEEARAKNKAHAKKINNEVLADMVAAGCSEECAKAIITAMARGKIRNCSINY